MGLLSQGAIHLIVSIDNSNEDIKKGCEKDYQKTTEFFGMVANDAGMTFQPHRLNFNQNEVYEFFQNFQCTSEDVVIFFYSGHGFRNENDAVIWPFLYYCNFNEQQNEGGNINSCGVPLDWVHQMLISKNPRMSITLGNSCNNIIGDPAADKRAQGLKKQEQAPANSKTLKNMELIKSFRGHIIASGASPGQYSYTNDEGGSYFVNELVDVLWDGLIFAEQPTSWASILKKTRDEVQKKKQDQRPQYLIIKDNKKMYSEGKDQYTDVPSYKQLNLENVPEIEEDDYESWEMEDFDEDDYSMEWEMEYDQEENEEMALENLPYILLHSVELDDGIVSEDESRLIAEYYLSFMENQYFYDRETAQMMLDFAHEDMNNEIFNLFFEEATREFRDYLGPEVKSDILSQLSELVDDPDAERFQTYIQNLTD
ncbi:MAG: hypothetical protein DHS20C18_10870 [Saprospiraceae bacterium]|nr:MAG: hypothetical protein DHS20C18_10870 [Saprospiraceae bacterium]